MRVTPVILGAGAAVLALAGAACSGQGSSAVTPDAVVAERQAERLQRVADRHARRDEVLDRVAEQRDRALDELRRIERVRGRSKASATLASRYGSDGTGDPSPWRQNGKDATKAPNSTPQTITRFVAAQRAGRIRLVGAAKQHEVSDGLIDDRILRLLIEMSADHRLDVNSLRVSHPRHVQDDLGTPTASNHVYGRSADISAVDGVPCVRESRRAPYQTLLDNPPPRNVGPCLAVAMRAAQVTGELALGETIFYWRVPGPSGVSLPNHDDHVHLGYRSYPGAGAARPTRDDTPLLEPAGKPEQQREPQVVEPEAGVPLDSGEDMQLPDPGDSKTLGED